MKRDKILRMMEFLFGLIEDDASTLTDLPDGVNAQYLKMMVKGIREDIDMIESFIEDLEIMDDSGQLED